jgi:N-acetylneuraminate synthase
MPAAQSQHAMLKSLELAAGQQLALRALADSLGITFLSSPFDEASVDFLARDVGVSRIKIPSGEVINGPLLLRAIRTGLPLIVSTGMCTLDEVVESLSILAWGLAHAAGVPPTRSALAELRRQPGWIEPLKVRVWLLHCVTRYPAPASVTNLRAMTNLQAATGLVVGFSDHSRGWHIALAAVAMGARVLEKHFTLSRRLPGPDHSASLEPDELTSMVGEIREVEAAMGNGEKVPDAEELHNREPARGSVVAARPIEAGQRIALEDLTVKRPGDGLSPVWIWNLVGRRALAAYRQDTQISQRELPEIEGASDV